MSPITAPQYCYLSAGDTAHDIARKAKCTPRTVRDALHRHGIALPREARNAAIDLDDVFDRYRRGVPVKQIAASIGVSAGWVTDRVEAHGIVRDVPIRRASRPSRHPELDDPDWLRRQLAHVGMTTIAKRLGTSRTNVRAAIGRHGITPPPQRADRLVRAAWTPDSVMRYEVAGELAAEAEETLRGARELQSAAVRELAASRLGTAEIAQRLSVAAATVRHLLDAPAAADHE